MTEVDVVSKSLVECGGCFELFNLHHHPTMPAPKRSVFRGPDAQHFQLVHRSLRDPLINDPEASQRVLKPVERGNDRDKVICRVSQLDM